MLMHCSVEGFVLFWIAFKELIGIVKEDLKSKKLGKLKKDSMGKFLIAWSVESNFLTWIFQRFFSFKFLILLHQKQKKIYVSKSLKRI